MPGTWTEKVGRLKLCDYDVPETTCLVLVGQSGSGKSSLINRISKVFDDDKFAPERAQISCMLFRGISGHRYIFFTSG
jgi:ABC-type lipoprotein export system ATPase subunit